MSKSNKIGEIGELLAGDYLKEKGHTILHRNYRTPLGEIDIITRKQQELFFVEVKTRKGKKFGSGIEAITGGKLQKIQKAAEIYLNDIEWSGMVRLMFVDVQYYSEKHVMIECFME